MILYKNENGRGVMNTRPSQADRIFAAADALAPEQDADYANCAAPAQEDGLSASGWVLPERGEALPTAAIVRVRERKGGELRGSSGSSDAGGFRYAMPWDEDEDAADGEARRASTSARQARAALSDHNCAEVLC